MRISTPTIIALVAFVCAETQAFLVATPRAPLVAQNTRLFATSFKDVDDKVEVKEYFNNDGFERWNKIYSESAEVNKVQADIRVGHQQTIDKILNWMDQDGIKGESFCDAGCGVGSLAIPLAERGAKVYATDISAAMVKEAGERAKAQLGKSVSLTKFATSDLEDLTGSYDTVTCVDVMIHYPSEKMAGMVQKLGSLSKKRMIISFAPKTWYYDLLKKVGELFPGPSKTTRAYLHTEEDVRKALKDAGFTVRRNDMTATNFYFSRLLEAVRE